MVCALGKVHGPIPGFKMCRMLPGLIPSNYILRFNMFNLGSREAVQQKLPSSLSVSVDHFLCFLHLFSWISLVLQQSLRFFWP